jgi:NADPH:quinone reductase-like Zn-dependent oxidoreductase
MSESQKTMHAAVIDKFGGPISIRTLPVPSLDAGEVLIRVEAAGIGVWDPFEQEGGFAEMMGSKPTFPYVLGSEGAGSVVEAGPNVKHLKSGDRVYAVALGNPKGGFYAEYVAVPAQQVSKIPGGLNADQAGVMPIDAFTGLIGLEKMGLKSGESILVFGASGGIGHLALQLAQRLGARVLAVASGADGVALVKKIGVEMVIDGHRDDVLAAARKFAPGGLDCILLTAGGEKAEQSLGALRKGGRVAYPNGVEPVPKAREGITMQSYDGMPGPGAIEKLNGLIEQGPFTVHVDRVFPLEKVSEAHAALKKHFLGKLALRTV